MEEALELDEVASLRQSYGIAARGEFVAKMTFAEWFRSLTLAEQRLMERHLTATEVEEIMAGSRSTFMQVSLGPKGGKGREHEASSTTAEGVKRPQAATEASAKADAQRVSANPFAGLASSLDEEDRKIRNLAKKDRRAEERREAEERRKQEEEQEKQRKAQARRQAQSGEEGAGGQAPPSPESRLAKAHSTASSTPATQPSAKKKPKRLTAKEIDTETSVKSLRRKLIDHGVAQADAHQFSGQPDEVKQLRAFAKSLPTVCSDAPNHARRSMRFDASADAQREVELHLAQINVGDTAQSSKPATPGLIDKVAQAAGAVAESVSEAVDAVGGAVSGALSVGRQLMGKEEVQGESKDSVEKAEEETVKAEEEGKAKTLARIEEARVKLERKKRLQEAIDRNKQGR